MHYDPVRSVEASLEIRYGSEQHIPDLKLACCCESFVEIEEIEQKRRIHTRPKASLCRGGQICNNQSMRSAASKVVRKIGRCQSYH